jgi:hypothetical protein
MLTMRFSTAMFLLLPLVSAGASAADCDANFTSSGNVLTGQTYRTNAALPGVGADAAFQGAYRYLAQAGWNIERADGTAGVLVALNANAGPGRRMALNVTVEPAGTDSRVTLNYANPAGAFSPEAAIRGEFCKLVAAAAAAPAAGARPAGAVPPHAVSAQQNTQAAGPALCLANACLGMTLEQAGTLKLRPRGTSGPAFAPTQERLGMYGIDAKGKLVNIDPNFGIDNAWIRQYAGTVKTLCAGPGTLRAVTSTSDGTPVSLTFVLGLANGKPAYVVNEISRTFPLNMSEPEQRNLETQLRARYGAAFAKAGEPKAQQFLASPDNRQPFVLMTKNDLLLKGVAPPPPGQALLEQPGCSTTVNLD